MLTFASKYSKNFFSQFGEDGIIEEILNRVPPNTLKKECVEFGGHDGYFCSNTRNLINKGWKGTMYDINPGSPEVIHKEITPENVEKLPFSTILSIDCDGPDYNIWKAYARMPRIVIIEVNSSFAPPLEVVPGDHGASFTAMAKLGISKGYFLLCHTGNMIFIDEVCKEYFPEVISDPISNPELYFNTSHLTC